MGENNKLSYGFAEDDPVRDKLEQVQREYLDFRFEQVEKELTKIRELLESSINTHSKDIKDLSNEVDNVKATLVEYDKEFIIIKDRVFQCSDKLKKLEDETYTSRHLFRSPVVTFLSVGFVVIVIIIALGFMDFDPIIKILSLIK
mgnify:CR=1 FL=1